MRDYLFNFAVFTTVFCTAVNCYTWRLGYPLWALAGDNFAAIHHDYLRQLTPVITLPHVLMFFATLAAAVWPKAGFAPWRLWLVFALATVVILLSAFVAGPIHSQLEAGGMNANGLRTLIQISAWRSVLMLAASAILLA